MKYCSECGTKLEMRACKGEDHEVPYCPTCQLYRFPTFSTAIITAIINSNHTKLMLMRQYGREQYNFLAGYVNKGEDAESTLQREMWEEMQMKPKSFRYLFSEYFDRSNTLMLCYLTEVEDEDLSGMNKEEVDDAQWFDYETASRVVIRGGTAENLLWTVKNEFKK